jgi:hypothetical protein
MDKGVVLLEHVIDRSKNCDLPGMHKGGLLHIDLINWSEWVAITTIRTPDETLHSEDRPISEAGVASANAFNH